MGLWINNYASVLATKNLKGPPLLIHTAYDLLRVLKCIKDRFRLGPGTLRGIPDSPIDAMLSKTRDLSAVRGDDAFILCGNALTCYDWLNCFWGPNNRYCLRCAYCFS